MAESSGDEGAANVFGADAGPSPELVACIQQIVVQQQVGVLCASVVVCPFMRVVAGGPRLGYHFRFPPSFPFSWY